MAFWDFIKAIRRDEEEEKRRDQEGGVGNRIFGFLDDALDVGGRKTMQVARSMPEPVKDVVGGVAGLGREIVAKPIMKLGQTVDEAQTDGREKLYDDLLGLSEEERESIASKSADEDSRSVIINEFKSKYGDLKDETIRKRKDEVAKENEDKKKPFTPDTAFEKAIFGNEDIHSVQGDYRIAEKKTDNPVLAGAYAGGLALLDSPLGGGADDAIKAVGKKGLKELSEATSKEAVQEILQRGGKISPEAIEQVSEAIAKTSDKKAVKDLVSSTIVPISKRAKTGKTQSELIQETIDRVGANTKVSEFVDAANPQKTLTEISDEATQRPWAAQQKRMEEAMNSSNYDEAQRAIDEITDPDVKMGMQSSLDALKPSGEQAYKTVVDPVTHKISKVPIDGPTPKAPLVEAPKPTGAVQYGEDADAMLGLMKSSSEIEKMKPGGGFKEKAYQQFFDKLSPLQKLTKQVEKQTGRKLATEENPYELARLYAGMPAQVKQKVSEVESILSDAEDLNAVRVIGMGRRILGRPDIKSTFTPEQAARGIEQMRAKLGEEGFAKANAAVDKIVKYNEDLLRELADSGVISKEGVDEIINSNPDYFARFQVVNKMLEKSGTDIFHSGQSLNLSKQDVVKAMKGMEEGTEILDPIEAIVKSTDLTMRTMAKNNIYNAMSKLADEAPELIVRIKDPENVVERMDLAADNKALRPIRNKLDRLIKTRSNTARKLETEINNLNKKGLQTSLKTEKSAMPNFTPEGLGGAVPTSQAGKDVVTSQGEKKLLKTMGETVPVNPSKLGPQDTETFLRNLVEGPNKELIRIKKMIGNRDPKLTQLIDEIQSLKGEYDDFATQIKANSDRARNELADADVPDGFGVIAGLTDGVGGKLAIPKEIADVYKGMTPSQMNYLTKIVSGVNRVMKETVTSLSLPFAFVRNPIRDFKAMAANSSNIKGTPKQIVSAWTKGFASALKKDEMYDRWIKAGGGGAGIYSNVESAEKIAQKVARQVQGRQINSAGDLVKEFGRILYRPIEGVQKAGATLEAAPRLAEFRAAVEKGVSDEGAAMASRNVTVDFNQSGTVGQVMNQWIPFLNARLQGNKKMLEAAKNNPARFAGVYATLTAAPILATAALNSQFKEVIEQIDQNTKDNNFLIVLGDGKDEKGNFTQVIKIPKADIDKVFGNPLENFVNFLSNNDSKGFDQVITEFFGNISPVDFVKDGSVDVSRAVGSVLPVALKIPVEQATNRNLYYGSDIVPENLQDAPNEMQVKENTPGIDKFLAGLVGGSPLKMQQARQGLTGQMFSEDPASSLGKSVTGANSRAPVNEFYKVKGKASQGRAKAEAYINDAIARGDYAEANNAALDYNDWLKTQFAGWNDRYGKYATDELQEQYDELKINLSKRSVKQRRKTQLEKAEKNK